jgi:hypothetical protein
MWQIALDQAVEVSQDWHAHQCIAAYWHVQNAEASATGGHATTLNYNLFPSPSDCSGLQWITSYQHTDLHTDSAIPTRQQQRL